MIAELQQPSLDVSLPLAHGGAAHAGLGAALLTLVVDSSLPGGPTVPWLFI